MKHILKSNKLFLVGLLMAGTLISCDFKSKPSILPEYTGEIKFDRAIIGKGQKVTASYVMPTGGTNIEPSSVHWNWGDGTQVIAPHTEQDGVSTLRFLAPAVGEQTIAFVGSYLNLEKSEFQTKSMSGKFNVVECDVFTSFWNDSKAVVMATADEKFEDNPDVLTAFVRNLIQEKEVHQYYFENDKLNKVVSTLVGIATEGEAVAYMNWQMLTLTQKGFNSISFDVVDLATGGKTAVDLTKLTDLTYTHAISDQVENGKLGLEAVTQNSKTTITLSYKLQAVGVVLNTMTYQPR